VEAARRLDNYGMKRSIMRARGNGRVAMDVVLSGKYASREDEADAAGLSIPMIAWARRIARFGAPELIQAVKDGNVSLQVGGRVARWGHADQIAFLHLDFTGGEEFTLTTRCVDSRASLGVAADQTGERAVSGVRREAAQAGR
jgi:hypothetical protein